MTGLLPRAIHEQRLARVIAIVACCAGLFAACSSSDNEAPDYLPGGPGGTNGSGSSSGGESGSPDAAPPPNDAGTDGASALKQYGGELATTKTSNFGGEGFCKYTMTLKDVVVDIRVLDTGEVTAATVKNTAVEKAIECPHAPMPQSAQEFTLKSSTIVPSGVRVAFTGASKNRPETSLVVDLAAKGGGYEAALEWHRTDHPSPLDWTVTATMQLAPK